MKKLSKAARNYVNKLQGYTEDHHKRALKYFKDGCILNALMELAAANKATNLKLSIYNHGTSTVKYQENVMRLIVRFNEVRCKDEDSFLLHMTYVEA